MAKIKETNEGNTTTTEVKARRRRRLSWDLPTTAELAEMRDEAVYSSVKLGTGARAEVGVEEDEFDEE